MTKRKFILACILLTCTIATILPACSVQEEQTVSYDPAKKYAAFAVINIPASESILATAKQQSTADGFEIGPIEYYSTQTTNFDSVVKKLTVSQQITLIWIIGGVMDVPAIRKSTAKFGYAGGYRFMPVQGQTVPNQLN
ncbi:MAG: hypothetical protein JXA01_01700 [Dehalococcoidia bacterium]|nr:hypothetical protein [Dehalococcoidia bacterium]